MKVITTYYYKCQGGINLSHHHPMIIEVKHGEEYQSGLHSNQYETLTEAENELCKNYDTVELIHIKTSYHQLHSRMVKRISK